MIPAGFLPHSALGCLFYTTPVWRLVAAKNIPDKPMVLPASKCPDFPSQHFWYDLLYFEPDQGILPDGEGTVRLTSWVYCNK
jgi:hypothetical protein